MEVSPIHAHFLHDPSDVILRGKISFLNPSTQG